MQTIEHNKNAWIDHTIISQFVTIKLTKEGLCLVYHKYRVPNTQLGLGANKFFKALISLVPWPGCCCIVEHKTMGPSFKVHTQSIRLPTTFKYFIVHFRLLFIIPRSPSCRFDFLDIFNTETLSLFNGIPSCYAPFRLCLVSYIPFKGFHVPLHGVHPLCVNGATHVKLFHKMDHQMYHHSEASRRNFFFQWWHGFCNFVL